MEAALDSTQAKLKRSLQEADTLRADNRRLKQRLTSSNDVNETEIASLSAAMTSLEQRMAQKSTDMDRLRADSERREACLAEQLAAGHAQRLRLQLCVEELTADAQAARKETASGREESARNVESLKQCLEAKQAEADTLKAELEAVHEERRNLMHRLAAAQQDANHMHRSLQNATEQVCGAQRYTA
jgi:chromosome segregation ATPase